MKFYLQMLHFTSTVHLDSVYYGHIQVCLRISLDRRKLSLEQGLLVQDYSVELS